MGKREIGEQPNISLYLEGRRLGAKSASIGSIVFAFLYLVLLYVNTYLIERIDTPLDLESFFYNIFFTIFGILVVWWLAWILSYFPARFMGGRLANSLEADARKRILSARSAILKGAQLGAISGCMIGLPILVLEFLFIFLLGMEKFFLA